MAGGKIAGGGGARGGARADAVAAVAGMDIGPGSDLISVLQDLQDVLGYLPADALAEVSRRTKIPLSRVYGVVSFYTQFHTAPRGLHTIRCCNGTACHVRGAQGVLDALGKSLRIRPGQTTADGLFTLETVACLGACFLAPVMMIDDDYYGRLTPQRIDEILHRYREGQPC